MAPEAPKEMNTDCELPLISPCMWNPECSMHSLFHTFRTKIRMAAVTEAKRLRSSVSNHKKPAAGNSDSSASSDHVKKRAKKVKKEKKRRKTHTKDTFKKDLSGSSDIERAKDRKHSKKEKEKKKKKHASSKCQKKKKKCKEKKSEKDSEYCAYSLAAVPNLPMPVAPLATESDTDSMLAQGSDTDLAKRDDSF